MIVPLLIILISTWVLPHLPGQQPFELTADMGSPHGFSKRLDVPAKSQNFSLTQYTMQTKTSLDATPESALSGIRCSDTFIRTIQGSYILENLKTRDNFTRRIKNEILTEYLHNKEREFPIGKKFLSGKVCEADDTTLFFMYSIGEYSNTTADNAPMKQAVLASVDSTAFIESFPPTLLPETRKITLASSSQGFIHCDQPFQVTRRGEVTLLCIDESDERTAFTVRVVNLQTGSSTVKETCVSEPPHKYSTVCR